MNSEVKLQIVFFAVMTTVNFSADKTQNMIGQLYCSANLTAEIHGQLTFISILNVLGSITAFLGNSVILVALRRESSLHPPSKLLLTNLAATDLCVGVILAPLTVILLISVVNEHWNICRYLSVTGVVIGAILFVVSLFTLTAISVDRLLALLLGLRYRQVVTLKRAYVIVVAFWVVSTALTGMYFWNPVVTRWCRITVIILSLVTSIFSYTKIYFGLRHHQNEVSGNIQQPHSNQGDELNVARYKKAVSSAFWLQFALVACFLPRVIALALLSKTELSPSVVLVNLYTITIVYFNSSLNPILYCWKIDELKQATKDTIRQALCYSFS